MSTSRTIFAALALTVAALVTAPLSRAQLPSNVMPQSSLDWQQRFLGIIPLVKPDPKDPVVVTVNSVPITAAQITDYARTEARLINATSTEETKAVFKDATENLINRQLLIDEAKRRNITIPDGEVAQRAREFQVSGISGEAVSQTGSPDTLLMDAVRGSMMIEKMLDGEFRAHHVQPTEEQMKQYYDEHKDLFVKDPGEVQISHIAVKLPDHPTDAQKKAAQEKISNLYTEAEKTRDFSGLAKKNSEDTLSAAKGGDLGFFRPGQLPPVVEKQAFATPVGHLTPILQSNLGFSFIKVTSRRGVSYADFKEVKPKIAMVLLGYNEEFVVKTLLKKLAKGAKIEFKKLPGSTA